MPSSQVRGKQAAEEQLRLLWRVAGMAFMLSAEVAAGAGVGWLIDRWQGTHPRWLTIGGVVGIVVGLTGLLKAAFSLSRSTTGRSLTKSPPEGESNDRVRHDD